MPQHILAPWRIARPPNVHYFFASGALPSERSIGRSGGAAVGWPGRPGGRPGRVSDKKPRHPHCFAQRLPASVRAYASGYKLVPGRDTERLFIARGSRMAQLLVASRPSRPPGRLGHPPPIVHQISLCAVWRHGCGGIQPAAEESERLIRPLPLPPPCPPGYNRRMDEKHGPPSLSLVIWAIIAAGAGLFLSMIAFHGDLALIAGSLAALTVATIKIHAALKKRR